MKRGNRAGNRFDVFMNVAAGNDTRAIPSNEEIRRRNLAEHAADLAAEEKTNADAAALAQRNAEEERLGISGMMQNLRAKDAAEAERLQRVWNRPFENLAVHAADNGQYSLDIFHQMVVIDGSCERSPEDVERAADAFFAILEDEGTILSDDDRRRILVYVGLNGLALQEKGIYIDGCANGTWRGALARLMEMGAIKPKQRPRTESRRPKITDHSSKEEDLNAVTDGILEEATPVFLAWQEHLLNDHGLVLNQLQINEAVDTARRMNLNPMSNFSWDVVRRDLIRRKVIRDCRTVDEALSDFIDTVPDAGSPAGRYAINEERRRLQATVYQKS